MYANTVKRKLADWSAKPNLNFLWLILLQIIIGHCMDSAIYQKVVASIVVSIDLMKATKYITSVWLPKIYTTEFLFNGCYIQLYIIILCPYDYSYLKLRYPVLNINFVSVFVLVYHMISFVFFSQYSWKRQYKCKHCN